MARRPAYVYNGSGWDEIGDPSKLPLTGGTVTGATAVEANSSSAALRVTQTGSGNALLVEDSANPDATPFVVDANGSVGIGTSAPANSLVVYNGNGVIDATRFVNNTGTGPTLITRKSASATVGTHASMSNGEIVGRLIFQGSDGTTFIDAASVRAEVDGTPGTNDMPGRMVFSTTADGASSPTERMRITSAGNVGIGTTGPTRPLDVRGTSEDVSVFTNTTDSSFTTIKTRLVAGTTNAGIADLVVQRQNGTSTDLILSLRDSGGTVTDRVRVTGAGNVGIGTSSPSTKLHVASSGTAAQAQMQTFGEISRVLLVRANGTSTSPTTVANGDWLADTLWQGYDGTAYRNAAQILARVNGTVSTAVVPGRITMSVADAAGTLTERFDLSSSGLITGTGTSLGAWTAYTPTWGGNTTNPVIGNGTITGAYCQIGKTVFGRVNIVAGSTTTFGSGSYFISMPVTARITDQPVGHGFFVDASLGVRYSVILTPASTTNLWIRYSAQPVDANATTPFTWAQSDEISVSFVYEAA